MRSARSAARGRAAAGLLAAALLWAALPGPGPGAPANAASLSGRLAARDSRAAALRAAIAVENHRLGIVRGRVAVVQARLARVEGRLAAEQARLAGIQAGLRREHARLVALERELEKADRALAANLRSQFESDPPDAITVILRSHGFADLLDRIEFVHQAKNHDQQVLTADRRARTGVIAAADRLGALDQEAQRLTATITSRRDDIDRIRLVLVDRAIRIERSRSAHAASLSAAEAQRSRLLSELAANQRAARRRASPGPGAAPPVVGSVLRGGGITFPLPGGAASPPGSWSDDQGVDVSAAGHTPLLAIGSGTIVLHGIGGFGSDAPVIHLDDGRFIYYGHAGPGNAVAIGTHVDAGAVISEIGAGIVGISSGPHLEIGFADANGTPVGPGTASTMHALLLAAYHG